MTAPSRSASTPTTERLDFWLVRLSLVLMFAAIVALLDTTIVNVAIDSLATEFNVPLSTIQWVSTGYLLAVAVAIPIAGWAIDHFGGRRVWLAATSAFLLGSLLAGLSWNAESLIAFRVFQGLGGGMIEPVVLASVAVAAGPNRIGRMMSLLLIPINIAPVIGPVLGGLIVDEVNWRWIFLVNVPVGLVSLLLGLKYIPHDEPQTNTRTPLDLVGVALLPPGFAAVIYALSASAEHGGFANATVITSAALGVVLIAAYVVHALRTRGRPLLDVRLFSNQGFAIASVVIALIASIGFATIFLLPLYYQQVHGASALRAGALVAPFGLGMGLGMALAGVYADRIPARRLGVAGASLAIVSSLALTLVERNIANEWIGLFALVRGFGMALIAGPTMASIYRIVKPDLAARATTAMYMVLQLGASLGVAITAVVLQARLNELGIARSSAREVAANPEWAQQVAGTFSNVFMGQTVLSGVLLATVLTMDAGKEEWGSTGRSRPDSHVSQRRVTAAGKQD